MGLIADKLPQFETKRLVVSESHFPNKSDYNAIVTYLRGQRTTGKLVINISQGGITTVIFEERQSVGGARKVEFL